MGSSLFTRRYFGNHSCFLFLHLLRCFNSVGVLTWLDVCFCVFFLFSSLSLFKPRPQTVVCFCDLIGDVCENNQNSSSCPFKHHWFWFHQNSCVLSKLCLDPIKMKTLRIIKLTMTTLQSVKTLLVQIQKVCWDQCLIGLIIWLDMTSLFVLLMVPRRELSKEKRGHETSIFQPLKGDCWGLDERPQADPFKEKNQMIISPLELNPTGLSFGCHTLKQACFNHLAMV